MTGFMDIKVGEYQSRACNDKIDVILILFVWTTLIGSGIFVGGGHLTDDVKVMFLHWLKGSLYLFTPGAFRHQIT